MAFYAREVITPAARVVGSEEYVIQVSLCDATTEALRKKVWEGLGVTNILRWPRQKTKAGMLPFGDLTRQTMKAVQTIT